MTAYLNYEGYRDPTAGKALSNIMRKERRGRYREKKMRTVPKSAGKNEKTGIRSVSGTR